MTDALEDGGNDGARPHILNRNHPLYSTQQAFMEVCLRTASNDHLDDLNENPEELFQAAVKDHEDFVGVVPDDVLALFSKWSAIHAGINAEINRDPEIQGHLEEERRARKA